MYIRIVTFTLAGIDPVQYEDVANTVAPQFLDWAGLELKFWLADEATNTYGGVYVFESQAHADASRTTELFAAFAQNPVFADLTTREFSVLDTPTTLTTTALLRH